MPNVSNDLSQKLYATMEKHKEVYKSNLVVVPLLTLLLDTAAYLYHYQPSDWFVEQFWYYLRNTAALKHSPCA